MTLHPTLLYAALTGVSLVWGTSFAAAQIGMRELAPLHLVTFRFILASLILAVMLLLMKNNNRVDRADLPKFFIMGFMAITSYFWIQYTGLQYITSIDAALIVATSPLVTAFLSAATGGERPCLRSVLGSAAAFTGVALVITKGDFSVLFQSNSSFGAALLLINSTVWACFTLYSKTVLKKYRPFVAIAYIHIFGTLLLLPAAFIPGLFAEQSFFTAVSNISAPTVGAALYLAILCSVYAYYVWYMGIEKLGAIRTAAFNYLNPLFAIAAGLLFMGETLSIWVTLGGSLVLGGVYCINSAKTAESGSQHDTRKLN